MPKYDRLGDVEKWWQRIQDWEGMYQTEMSWADEVLANYRNKFGPGLLTVNQIFAFGRSLIPQLYFKNPVVSVNIKQRGYEDLARTIQLMDDSLIECMQLKDVLKRVILSAHLIGRGVVKIGYSDEVDIDPDFADISMSGGYAPSFPTWKMRELVSPNRPWILDFATNDYAYDPEVKRIRDSNWFAMRFTKKVYEIMDSPGFSEIHDLISEDEDEDVDLWEVWDKYTGKFRTLYESHWVGPARDIVYWAFQHLDFNETLDTPLPVGDGQLMLPQQKEINEIKTQISEHRRISLLKLIARRNALDSVAKSKLERGQVGAYVEVDGDVNTAIKEFTPNIPVQLYTEANTNEQDIRAVIGFNRNAAGEFTETKRTALEAQIVQQSLQLRLDERRDMTADFMKRCIVTVNDMVMDRWEATDVEAHAGQSEGWEKRNQIRKTYVMKIVPDSTLPLSRTLAKQEAAAIFGLFRQDPYIDPIWLRLHTLEQYDSIDPKEALNKQAVAMYQQQQQVMAKNQPGLGAPGTPAMPSFPVGAAPAMSGSNGGGPLG